MNLVKWIIDYCNLNFNHFLPSMKILPLQNHHLSLFHDFPSLLQTRCYNLLLLRLDFEFDLTFTERPTADYTHFDSARSVSRIGYDCCWICVLSIVNAMFQVFETRNATLIVWIFLIFFCSFEFESINVAYNFIWTTLLSWIYVNQFGSLLRVVLFNQFRRNLRDFACYIGESGLIMLLLVICLTHANKHTFFKLVK